MEMNSRLRLKVMGTVQKTGVYPVAGNNILSLWKRELTQTKLMSANSIFFIYKYNRIFKPKTKITYCNFHWIPSL